MNLTLRKRALSIPHPASFVLPAALLLAAAGPTRADEGQAAARIVKLGGHVTRAEELPGRPVVKVALQATNGVDADLDALREFKQLKVLYLGYGTKTSDAGLARLAGLKSLEELYLPETQITDAGLAHLAGLRGLRKLGLLDCKGITDRGMVHLRGLTRLESLSLDGTGVTEAGAAALRKALPHAYISGGIRVLPPGSPTRAERKRRLAAAAGPDVSADMLDFMSFLDGTEQGSNAVVKQYAGSLGREDFDFAGWRLKDPRVVKTEHEGKRVCYTMQVKQGLGVGTYRLCWEGGKLRSVRQLSLVIP